MKMSVVIPCYNEAENIPVILKEFSNVIGNRKIEVILVNNGSTDDTAAVLKDQLRDYAFAQTVFVPVNQGYGYGILEGLKIAKGDYLGWTHGDAQAEPKDIIRVYDFLNRHAGENDFYIKGIRKGRKISEKIISLFMGAIVSLVFHMGMYDINAQPNIFSREFYQSWTNAPFDFSIEIFSLYQAKKQGEKIARIPVVFKERHAGISSWNKGLADKIELSFSTIKSAKAIRRREEDEKRSCSNFWCGRNRTEDL